MQIDALIDKAMPIMTAEVLQQARAIPSSDPLARFKFWYYDTCAPACYLLEHALTSVERDRIIATAGINAGDELWDGEGRIEMGVGLSDGSPCKPIFAKAYEWMCMDGDERAAASLTDNAREMSRILAQSLSRYLNALDWSDVCSVTDDFIVYAQNGTDYGCDCYEDLVASVPEDKLAVLRSRGLMGPGERYHDVPASQKGG